MQLGARAYVAKYNLDQRDDREQPSEEKLGHDLYLDLTKDYYRLRRKGNLFTTSSGQKLYWMLHAGITNKMEAIANRTTAHISWPSVITYFGTKSLEFYKDEGLQDGGTRDSTDDTTSDNGECSSGLRLVGVDGEKLDKQKLN